MKITCPECGTNYDKDNNSIVSACPFCGYQRINLNDEIDIQTEESDDEITPELYDEKKQMVEVKNPDIISDQVEDTLIIDYFSPDPKVKLVLNFEGIKEYYILATGQVIRFLLEPGEYVVSLQIGKITYNRWVIITETRDPVIIHCSWNQRAHIKIEQSEIAEIISGKRVKERAKSRADKFFKTVETINSLNPFSSDDL